MLKQRVITALLLAPLVVAAVLLAPTPAFAAGLALVMMAGAWEWSALVPLRGLASRLGYLGVVGAALLLGSLQPALAAWLPPVGVLWWLGAAIWLAFHEYGRHQPWPKGLAGVLVLLPCWAALVALHAQDPRRVLFVLVLVWCADIGAYFAGKRWGRRRLAPAISPGKTWIGTAGGLLAALAFAGLVAWRLPDNPLQAVQLALLAAVAVIFSDIGDLFVSLMKRQRGVKDSGKLLPGHGGILDRLDSLYAAAPVFATGLWLLGQ